MAIIIRSGTPTFSVTSASLTTTVTIPSGAHAGDLCIIVGSASAGTTWGADPAGFTAITGTSQASTPISKAWQKILVATDPGSTVTVTAGTSGTVLATCFCYTGTSGVDVGVVQRNATSLTWTAAASPTITPTAGTASNGWDMAVCVFTSAGGTETSFGAATNGFSNWAQTLTTVAQLIADSQLSSNAAVGSTTTTVSATSRVSNGTALVLTPFPSARVPVRPRKSLVARQNPVAKKPRPFRLSNLIAAAITLAGVPKRTVRKKALPPPVVKHQRLRRIIGHPNVTVFLGFTKPPKLRRKLVVAPPKRRFFRRVTDGASVLFVGIPRRPFRKRASVVRAKSQRSLMHRTGGGILVLLARIPRRLSRVKIVPAAKVKRIIRPFRFSDTIGAIVLAMVPRRRKNVPLKTPLVITAAAPAHVKQRRRTIGQIITATLDAIVVWRERGGF